MRDINTFYASAERPATGKITHAQMLLVRATPHTVIPAPSADKLIHITGGILVFDFDTAYTETAANLALKYENGSGAAAAQVVEATGFMDGAADQIINVLPVAINNIWLAASIGKAIVLHNNGAAEYGAGAAGNLFWYKLFYRVYDFGEIL